MNQQNNNGDWVYGIAIISVIVLCVVGTDAGFFSALALIGAAVGFFKWLWFS